MLRHRTVKRVKRNRKALPIILANSTTVDHWTKKALLNTRISLSYFTDLPYTIRFPYSKNMSQKIHGHAVGYFLKTYSKIRIKDLNLWFVWPKLFINQAQLHLVSLMWYKARLSSWILWVPFGTHNCLCKSQFNVEGDDTFDKLRHFFSTADTDQLSTFWHIGEGILLILSETVLCTLLHTFLDRFLIYNYTHLANVFSLYIFMIFKEFAIHCRVSLFSMDFYWSQHTQNNGHVAEQ
jgi:hypothetical protein